MSNQSQEQEQEHGEHAELLDLADAQINGELDADGLARLEALLAGDAEAQRVYLRYVDVHATLATGDSAMQLPGWRERLSDVLDVPIGAVVLDDREEAGADGASTRGSRRRSQGYWRSFGLALAATFVIVAGGVTWVSLAAERRAVRRAMVATVENGEHLELSETGRAIGPGELVQRSTLRLRQGDARLQFHNGAELGMSGPTLMRLDSDRATTLISGSISARVPPQAIGFTVTTPSVHVVDLGTDFNVHVDDAGHTVVKVNKGVVVMRPRHRMPRFWWTFDDSGGAEVSDAVRQASGRLHGGATRIAGLIGAGAVRIDNTNGAGINVGNGGGTSPGTGGFAVTTGITIEAVIAPDWTAQRGDYDEILRKDDGRYRILLSFQNDDGARVPMHPDAPRAKGPTLSFGLFLDGVGYSEMEAVLDGADGRPSLADLTDGKPHHVAATYDAQTGVKALYIDGRLVQRYTFAVGTPIISGGATDAWIGNLASGAEPYNGVIDEVAFYDYALTAEEVAAHHANVRRGVAYFEPSKDSPNVVLDEFDVPVVTLRAGQSMRFHAVTGQPMNAR